MQKVRQAHSGEQRLPPPFLPLPPKSVLILQVNLSGYKTKRNGGSYSQGKIKINTFDAVQARTWYFLEPPRPPARRDIGGCPHYSVDVLLRGCASGRFRSLPKSREHPLPAATTISQPRQKRAAPRRPGRGREKQRGKAVPGVPRGQLAGREDCVAERHPGETRPGPQAGRGAGGDARLHGSPTGAGLWVICPLGLTSCKRHLSAPRLQSSRDISMTVNSTLEQFPAPVPHRACLLSLHPLPPPLTLALEEVLMHRERQRKRREKPSSQQPVQPRADREAC